MTVIILKHLSDALLSASHEISKQKKSDPIIESSKPETAILNVGCHVMFELKSGKRYGAIVNKLDGDRLEVLQTEVVDTPHTHGTGCTLSAAITANLALGKSRFQAVQDAKKYVTEALKYSLAIGKGQGPVGHFFPLLVPLLERT